MFAAPSPSSAMLYVIFAELRPMPRAFGSFTAPVTAARSTSAPPLLYVNTIPSRASLMRVARCVGSESIDLTVTLKLTVMDGTCSLSPRLPSNVMVAVSVALAWLHHSAGGGRCRPSRPHLDRSCGTDEILAHDSRELLRYRSLRASMVPDSSSASPPS